MDVIGGCVGGCDERVCWWMGLEGVLVDVMGGCVGGCDRRVCWWM